MEPSIRLDPAGGRSVNIVPPIASRASRRISQALLLTFCAAATARAQAGRVTGIISDSAAGFPVAGVTVALTGTTLGGVSAENGRYTIAAVPPGTYTLEARRLGYTPVATRALSSRQVRQRRWTSRCCLPRSISRKR
jgi:hypothetical protein